MNDSLANALRLTLDGEVLDLRHAIAGLRLQRRLNRPAELALRWTEDAAALPRPGQHLTLADHSTVLFAGDVIRVERETGPRGTVVDIAAHDALAGMIARQTRGVEVAASIHGFVRRLVSHAGLQFRAVAADFPCGRLLNRYGDDHTFLTAVLSRYGLGCVCQAGEIVLLEPGGRALGRFAPRGRLRKFRHVQEPHLAAPSTVTGWAAAIDRPVESRPALARGLCGQLGLALAPDEPVDRLRHAEDRYRAACADWIEAEIVGAADLWPGSVLIAPEDGAEFWLTESEIHLDAAEGLRTLVSSCPPPRPVALPSALFTGSVVRIGDPQGAGRVQISLHGFDGAQTGWLPVIAPGGGNKTGLAAPLAVGDPALLVAPEGDPERGIVLGGLLRAGGPQRDAVRGEDRTAMRWQGRGMAVLLDEANGRLTMNLDDGAAITLERGRLRLSAPDHLELDCPGRVTVRGRRIDFQEA